MLCSNSTGNSTGDPHDVSGDTVDRNLTGQFASNSFAADFLAKLDLIATAAQAAARNCVRVLDVGTGTARIPIEICTRRGDIVVTAVDRATRALQTARRNVEQAGMTCAIQIEKADASSLPYANASFDAVISSSLLHHVSNRHGVLTEMTRVLRPGGLLFVRDTLRGSDVQKIAEVLSRSSCATHEARRAVFQRAFHAMPNVDEAREMALAAGLPAAWVRQSGPRHWIICGRLPDFSPSGRSLDTGCRPFAPTRS